VPLPVLCDSVCKRFGAKPAVVDLNLEVPAGVCFGLLGPNGAGKTTALKMIYGSALPSAGRVLVFGMDVAQQPRAVRQRLGVTLQENALIEVLSPRDNLRVFGRYHLMTEPAIEQRIEELLDFLDLRSHAELPVQALSGGFQRRLSIALSLLNRPELLVLDEPTTGLDPAVRLSLWERLRALRAGGATILLTTHYMDEAERLCDDLAIVAHGKVVARGAPKELIASLLAPQALELELPASRHGALLNGLHSLRHTASGDRLTVYAKDAAALLDHVRRAETAETGGAELVSVRPTNLEDVFLSLTGAHLSDGD